MKLEMYALYKMIYECCGEDRDTLENAEITETSPNKYHVAYKEDNPFKGVSFDVAITIKENEHLICQYTKKAHYVVTNSVYGDDGELELEL